MKSSNQNKPPSIDGKLEDATYCAFSWKIGKEKAAKIFISRYGIEPENVFYGPPNGSILFAGPIPDDSDTSLSVFDKLVTVPILEKLDLVGGIDK